MAGLVTESRVYPTFGHQYLRNSGTPESDAIHVFCRTKQVVDARVKPAHDGDRMAVSRGAKIR